MGVKLYLLAFYAMVILKHFECGYAEDIETRGKVFFKGLSMSLSIIYIIMIF